MRIRAVVPLALAAVAVAILMAMPAFAAKAGTEHPYKASGTAYGTYTYKEGPPEVFTYDVDGPFIGSLGKGTTRTYTDASGKNERSISTLANGDKLYSTSPQDETTGPVASTARASAASKGRARASSRARPSTKIP